MTTELIERSFQAGAPARLLLKNIRGRVEILGGEGDQITISAAIHTSTGNANLTRVEIEQAADGSVSAITHYDGRTWFGLGWLQPSKVDYSVRLPRQCQLEVSCVECSVRVQNLDGDLQIKLVSGSLSLEDLSGTLAFSTVSGGIKGEGLVGPLRVKTVSAGVHLKRSRFPSVHAKTVSGGLTLETSFGEGPYSFDSVSGSTRLYLPVNTRCSLQFHSISGGVQSDLGEARRFHGSGRVRFDIGGGGAELNYKSVSGGLYLLPGAPAPDAPDSEEDIPESEGLTADERRDILERIERGELSAGEALEALRG